MLSYDASHYSNLEEEAMPSVQKSIRFKEKIFHEIEQIARNTGEDFSTVTNELLDEAVKTLRCPGIVFSEGAAGRRARIAGTGIEVWEVIAAYKSIEEDFKRLSKAYNWLAEQQLMAAVGYYKAYPEDIDPLIRQNEELTDESVNKKYPFLRGRG